MSTTTRPSEKGSAVQTDNQSVSLIDRETLRRLDDEQTDADGCRFGAVARSLETIDVPFLGAFPVTRVAYVDGSGQYAIERQYPGHGWRGVPRTVVVTDPDTPQRLPDTHAERYAPVLEHHRELAGE